jgi:hypothetical protein
MMNTSGTGVQMMRSIFLAIAFLTTTTALATTLSFSPSADARISAYYPDTNFGSEAILRVDSNPRNVSYLKFDVSGISGSLSSAKLRLFVKDASGNGPQVVRAGTGWNESLVTYNNPPWNSTTVLADVGAISAGTWIEYDITSAISADGKYSFALLPGNEDRVDFASSEATNKPQLVITFSSPSPSPSPSPSATPAPSTGSIEIPSGYTVVSALNKGVKCNGSTDDTAALQNALNGLQSNQALKLPAGTCVTSKHVTLRDKTQVAVVGAGKDSTIIKALTPLDSAFIVEGGDTVLLADFQVYSPNSTRRGSLPVHDCFALIQSPKNITIDGLKARMCAAGGFLIAHGINVLIQNSVVDHSRADAYHVAYGSQNVTVQFSEAIAPGDDMFASIGYSSVNRNINFLDNVGRDGGWAGGVHYDGTIGGKAYRNKISDTGVSCFAVSADGGWGSSSDSDYIDFQNNSGTRCASRTDTGHAAIMVYTWQSSWALGPHITFNNNVIDNPYSNAGFKAQAFDGSVNVTVTNTKFLNLGRCFTQVGNSTITKSGNTLNGVACN